MACCYALQLSEVRAGSVQDSSGMSLRVVIFYLLVHLPQAALGLPFQLRLRLRQGKGTPPLLGREVCYFL